MPRARVIRPSILSCPAIDHYGYQGNYFWIGLILNADDAGRLTDDTVRLQKAIFQRAKRPPPVSEVQRLLTVLSAERMIHRYEGPDGKRYIQIVNWWRYQKVSHPTPSIIPAPNSGKTPEPLQNSSGASRDEEERRGVKGRGTTVVSTPELDSSVPTRTRLPGTEVPIASDPGRRANTPPGPAPLNIPRRPPADTRPRASLRQLEGGGAPCPPDLLRDTLAGLPGPNISHQPDDGGKDDS